MNEAQRGIVALLKSAVTGEKADLPDGFDLEQAAGIVLSHHCSTLVWKGALQSGFDPQKPFMQKLFQYYCKAVQVNRRQMRELERIFTAFDEHGIDYMPLKGCILKKLYPAPEMRMMGDADILIRLEQYERIIPVLQELGLQEKQETEHELVWASDALKVELHKWLIAPSGSEFPTYFGNGWPLAKRAEGCRHAMTPEDTFVYLFTHFTKHYRGSGIGCRHLVDLWVYLRAHPGLDEARVREALALLHLERFYQNVRRTISVWFEDGDGDETTRLITEFLFSSGSWGSQEQGTLASGVRNMQQPDHKLQGKAAYILKRIFPDVSYLRLNYPVLKKAPYLLPGVWVHFLVSRVFFTRSAWKKHARNLSVLTKENLDSHRQMLERVGLDHDR